MAGLVPAIHVCGVEEHQGVYARHKAGHDEAKKLAVWLKATEPKWPP
jgi:hypothetical protein